MSGSPMSVPSLGRRAPRPAWASRPARGDQPGPAGVDAIWALARRFDAGHPRAGDTVVAAGVAVISTPWLLRHTHQSPAAWVCDVALIVPLVWRRRFPVAVFGAIAAVALVQWLVTDPLVADASLLVALFTVATERNRQVAAAGGLVLEVGVVLASVRWSLADSWVRSFVFLSGLVLAALVSGAYLRTRRAHLVELIQRAARLEYERDQQAQIAAASERTRIAREMHDVIAHSLAVIVTMADAATAKLHTEPERAEAAIHNVSEIGRQALNDTRRLLGVLRDDRTETALTPQPGIDQIPGLVRQLEATGLRVHAAVVGDPFAMPTGAELAVFRVIQEATTNTLKHAAAPTCVRVCLTYDRPHVRIEVVDDGAPVDCTGASGPAAAGHGLTGMRERAALYRGHVDAGPAPARGWAVSAVLTVGT